MKKLVIPVVVMTAIVCLAAGCVGEVETYTDSGQTISVGLNQEFVIALGSNPTTGYSWRVSYDQSRLELVGGESTYEVDKEAEPGMVGAGGVEYFRFKALRAGQSEVIMTYQRPWQEESLEEKVFTVSVE